MNSVIICNNSKSGCLWLMNNFTTCNILICSHRCMRVLAIYALVTVTVIDLWQSWTMVFIQDKLAQNCILCFTKYIILWHMVITLATISICSALKISCTDSKVLSAPLTRQKSVKNITSALNTARCRVWEDILSHNTACLPYAENCWSQYF